MTSLRLFLVSTAPCLVWVSAVGCGNGGGFRGATLTHDDGGSESVTSGAGGITNGGAGAGGMNAGGALVGGASGGDAGAGGATTDAGAGMGGENVGAGQAGTAGAGAGAGALGTGGVAGEASGGVSGSSIVAGGGAGGTAGSGAMSGGAGAAGSGGTAGGGLGGSAGMSGGAAGSSGGSSGGSAGAGGPLGTCAERCSADADCRIFGVDQGYRCNPSTHRCETFAAPCRSSLECLPDASFWIFDCATDADCFFFSDDLCVDVAGVGRCARLAPSPNGCVEPNADEVTLPRFGATGSVLVCANTSHTCFEGACVPGCRSNTDCVPERNGSVCDIDAHLCRCVRDEDCGGLGVSRCNTATGRCECADSRDCEEVPNANTCNAGRCGCAAVSACNVERTFSGTSYVCE